MSEDKPRKLWSPDWAPHVKGWHEEREVDPETGIPESAGVGATCEHVDAAGKRCGTKFQRQCASGLFRQWIAQFAMLHIHKEHFNP